MAHTEAHQVRHRKSFIQLRGDKTANLVAGYARQLSHPAYENLVRYEPILRKLVPILIVLFLAVAGLARWIGLANQSAQIKTSVDAEMHFIAELVQEKLLNAKFSGESALASMQAQNILSDAVSSKYLENNRQVALTDSSGKIIANLPYRSDQIGSELDTILGDVTLLTTFGGRAESQLVSTSESRSEGRQQQTGNDPQCDRFAR